MINKKMMSTMAVLGMMLAGGTLVNAQTRIAPSEEAIPVIYDNRNVLPDSNAQYGMVIPTAISFTDDRQTADASIEIVGMNGYELDTDWTDLEVTVSIASANGFKLLNQQNEVNYKLDLNGQEFNSTTGTTATAITKTFGVGGQNGRVKEISGTASLDGKVTKKGQYTDTLTYSFTENSNTRV